MLSFELLCAQEGQLDKENFGISKLIASLYPDGILANHCSRLLTQSQNSKRRERKGNTRCPKSASSGRAAVSTRMSFISGPSGYELVPLREDLDFTLYLGRQRGNPSPILAVALAAEQPSPQSLRRLEHEYSLAAELDTAWAAKPLALTRHEGRTILLLNGPGGESLDRILERNRGQPLELTHVRHRHWLGDSTRSRLSARPST